MSILGWSICRRPVAVISLMAVLALSRLAAAQEATELTAQERERLVLLTDAKGHYIVLLPVKIGGRSAFFYSPDGKLLYEQQITSAGGEVDKNFNYLFVDP